MLPDYSFEHNPVLFEECLDALNIRKDGFYVDCTAGGGGHSLGILNQLGDNGRVLSLDKDDAALEHCKTIREQKGLNNKWIIVKSDFAEIVEILKEIKIQQVDGVLADLGVSSYQLDTAERGFSYTKNGPLDMRMDMKSPLTAAELVNTYDEAELVRIFRLYGEERYSGRIVKAILKQREQNNIQTTEELSSIILRALPAKARNEAQHPARRVFQAIRICVNRELDAVEKLLSDVPDLLKKKGRFAVISFHSLEDRLVKEHFKNLASPCICPREFPVCVCGREPLGKMLTGKAIIASEKECKENNRARSARLRVFERS